MAHTSGSSPTIKEIARAAGVSPGAVSLALRNQPGVSEGTRTRIKALAQEMGYRHDPVVARLMAQLKRTRRKQTTLAFVTDHEQPFARMRATKDTRSFEGARERAALLGYELTEFQVSGEMDGHRLSRILWTRGVDGILVGPLRRGATRLDLDWERFPCVSIGHSLREPQLHKASNNQFQSVVLAFERLYAMGYRRIGVLTGKDTDVRINHAGKAGCLLSRDRLELRYPRRGVVWIDDGFESFARWMEKERPDALVATTSFSPVAGWLEKLGLRVPGDLGLAMLHLMRDDVNITGIDQQWWEIGASAVERLVSLVHARQTGVPRNPSTLMLDGQWVEGSTTRPQEKAG